jgi:hypothetical protein
MFNGFSRIRKGENGIGDGRMEENRREREG